MQAVGKIRMKLEERGLIRGYTAELSLDNLGLDVVAVLMLKEKDAACSRKWSMSWESLISICRPRTFLSSRKARISCLIAVSAVCDCFCCDGACLLVELFHDKMFLCTTIGL